MGRMCCGCLNVKLHTKKPIPDPLTLEQLGPGLEEDDFFALPITEIQLDLEGVRIEQACLVRSREVGDWTIHECINCELQTHAVHARQGNNKVLINTSLKSDPTIIERLENSLDFSPLYKVILHSKNDNFAARSLGVQSERYESIQHDLNRVQQSLNRFLQDEQNAMEDRIRVYEEQQRSAFAEMQSKARRDKNTMISLIMRSEDGDSDSDVMTDSPISPFSPNSMKVSDVTDGDDTLSDVSNYLQQVHLPDLNALPKKTHRPAPRPQQLMPARQDLDDPLFDMDGVDFDDSRPFYHSDDDNDESTDDSTPEDSGSHYDGYSRGGVTQRSILSSSVPISVPRWHQATHRQVPTNTDTDSTVPVPTEPEDMAASIKALAKSVHGDGTEMFGERPRPRLNTLDMGNL